MLKLRAQSQPETQGVARAIAGLVRAGDMIVLAGEMGAGKTLFTQAFGAALGVTEPITSPTFNLLHNYSGTRLSVHHADLYRLERTGELADLGLTELQESGGVVIVEWGDIVGDALGEGLIVRLLHSPDVSEADLRAIEILGRGQQWASRWEKLRQALSSWRQA